MASSIDYHNLKSLLTQMGRRVQDFEAKHGRPATDFELDEAAGSYARAFLRFPVEEAAHPAYRQEYIQPVRSAEQPRTVRVVYESSTGGGYPAASALPAEQYRTYVDSPDGGNGYTRSPVVVSREAYSPAGGNGYSRSPVVVSSEACSHAGVDGYSPASVAYRTDGYSPTSTAYRTHSAGAVVGRRQDFGHGRIGGQIDREARVSQLQSEVDVKVREEAQRKERDSTKERAFSRMH